VTQSYGTPAFHQDRLSAGPPAQRPLAAFAFATANGQECVMTWKHKLSKRLALLKDSVMLVLALAGCADGTLTGSPDELAIAERRYRSNRPVASVTVSPGSVSLLPSGTAQLTATLRDSTGRELDRAVTWSSSAPGVAKVSASGLVTGVAAGLATITATSEGRSGSATATVSVPAAAPVASVTVSPATATITVGATVQLSAITKDANGQVLTGRTVTWSVGNAAVVTVSALGVVTGIAAGTASVTATSEGRSGSAIVTVSAPAPPPPTFQIPDILDNAGFETDWSGLTSWGGTAPTVSAPRTLTRDSTRAYAGRASARFSLPATSGSDLGAQFGKILATGVDRLWTRFYFYLDVAVNGTLKFNIYQAPGFGTQFGGVYFQSGYLGVFISDNATGWTNLARLSSLTGGWHSLEVEYWRNGDPSGFPSLAFWLDGQPITASLNTPPAPTRWSGGRLVAGVRTSSAPIGTDFLAGVLNGNPANTVTGNLWIDRVSISSRGRIGP
jgi:hypothetical protein